MYLPPLLLLLSTVACHALSSSTSYPSSSTPTPPKTKPPFQLSRLDHIVIRCKNFPKMFHFYTNILGCTVDQPTDVRRFGGALSHLRAGEAYIDLLSYDTSDLTTEGEERVLRMHSSKTTRTDKVADIQFSSQTSTLDHLCIRVDPFEQGEIEGYLKEQGVDVVSSGIRKGAEGVGPSIYIQDPEGNTVELKGPSTASSQQSTVTEAKARAETSRAVVTDTVQTTVSPETEQPAKMKEISNEQSSNNSNDESVLAVTPCTRICRYNQNFYDGQVCIGCFRESYEIGTWSTMSDMERSYALLDAADRRQDRREDEFPGSITKDELLRQARMWEERPKKANK